ncbi:VPLPA-CTERM sorting domain-containing protein [uncultured Roseobacter sp.]|uniref:VPLPA-CTERM sorting domain-containing protein n=1 Tax=uncultured Roseobacter sp. TaxID=114847 RepID=UPI0026305C4E|nr:hypothetical protein [uncultured Roseobacter sp.]
MSITRFLTAILFSLWATSGQTASVTWTMDINLENSGSAIGSFVWDSELNTVTSWDITVSEGLTSVLIGVLPGQTFSSASAGHVSNTYIQGGFSFINFETDDVTYWYGPDRPRHFRLGFGYDGFDVLDTPVEALLLIGDTLNKFPVTKTGVTDCGSCSPSRSGRPGSVLSAVPAPVPLPGALPLTLLGFAALGFLHRRRGA